jgi:hypothetical protein
MRRHSLRTKRAKDQQGPRFGCCAGILLAPQTVERSGPTPRLAWGHSYSDAGNGSIVSGSSKRSDLLAIPATRRKSRPGCFGDEHSNALSTTNTHEVQDIAKPSSPKPTLKRRRLIARAAVEATHFDDGNDEQTTATVESGAPLSRPLGSIIRTVKSVRLLSGTFFSDALAKHPHLTLAEYNSKGSGGALHKQDLVMLRVSYIPLAGSVVVADKATAPFSMTRNAGAHLEPVLGIVDLYANLRADMAELRARGESPIPVKVPLVTALVPGVDGAPISAQIDMLFVRDGSSTSEISTGGWIISQSRWEGRLHGGARRWRSG